MSGPSCRSEPAGGVERTRPECCNNNNNPSGENRRNDMRDRKTDIEQCAQAEDRRVAEAAEKLRHLWRNYDRVSAECRHDLAMHFAALDLEGAAWSPSRRTLARVDQLYAALAGPTNALAAE